MNFKGRFFIFATVVISTIIFLSFNQESNNSKNFQEQISILMDKMDEEIVYSEKKTSASLILIPQLSPELIKEIAALSKLFPPNSLSSENAKIESLVSPERGQLLQALINQNLSPTTYRKIFQTTTFEGAYLKQGNFKEANLEGIQLNRAYLCGIDLSNANLQGANLCKTDLSGADMSNANLTKTNLREANLSRTNLKKATLRNAYLINAIMNGVNLEGANIDNANLSGVDLNQLDDNLVAQLN